MNLTTHQQQQIAKHLIGVPCYMETYNEVYDHVISALEANDQGPFQMDMVDRIINDDFGGFAQVIHNEKMYQQAMTRNGFRHLREELFNSFKFPQVLSNIVLVLACLIFWRYTTNVANDSKPLVFALYVISVIALVFVIISYIINKTFPKPYFKRILLIRTAFSGTIFFGIILCLVNLLFDPSSSARFIMMLVLYFNVSVFVRAYLKVCNKQLKVLS